ncbi:MAG: short-chain dehydrogenase [Sandaracinus sp.]|nr:short-chain dehydrogenase [Sandaracinus sp.]
MLDRRRHGPWALVAGASEGLGAAFAEGAAAAGLGVIGVARSEGKLAATLDAIGRRHGVPTLAVPLDLARPDAAAVLRERVADREVGTLVYDAAYAPVGAFLDAPLSDALLAVDVNVRAPLALVHAFGGPMATRGRGAIVWVSSMSGFHGTARLATYAGTKAFGRVFTEGLWDELRAAGVDVLVSCPGAVGTPRYLATTAKDVGPVMDAEQVVRETYGALGHRPTLVPGRVNRAARRVLGRLLPGALAVRLMGRSTRTLYGE